MFLEVPFIRVIISFRTDKILDLSKSKAFAENKIRMNE